MRKFLNIAVAIAAVTVAAAPAAADPIFVDGIPADRARMTVDISGMGAGEIQRRISFAARRVCGAPETRSIEASARVQSCRANAVAEARQQIAGVAGATSVAIAAIY